MPGEPASCPVEATIAVVGGRWKPLILFHLLRGPRRFNALRRLLPEVTQQMLTLNLRELERDGIVHREVFPQVPPKVEYSVTPLGRSLEPLMVQMCEWGERYLALVREHPARPSRAVAAVVARATPTCTSPRVDAA